MLLDRRHELDGLTEVIDRRSLGNLKTNPPGWQREFGKLGQHEIQQGMVVQRVSGQVNGHFRSRGAERFRVVAKGGPDNPTVDRSHQTVTFRRRDKSRWCHQFAVVIAHPEQKFKVCRRVAVPCQGDDGLTIQAESLLLQRIPQPGGTQYFAVTLGGFAVLGLVHMHLVAPTLLGRVAGNIRLTQELGGVFDAGRDGRQPDAHSDLEAAPCPGKSVIVDGCDEVFGDLTGLLQGAVVEQQAELVATQPGQGITLAKHPGQNAFDLFEQFIPCSMTGRVIDDLELIQVEITEGMMGAVLFGTGECTVQPFFELTPVNQPGEGVVRRFMSDLPGQLARLGDVAEHQHGAEYLSRGSTDRRGRILDRIFLPGSTEQTGMVRQPDDAAFLDTASYRVRYELAGLFVGNAEYPRQGLTSGFFHRPAGQFFGNRVEILDHAVGVGSDHRIANRVQGDLGTFLFLQQQLLSELALGDVQVGPYRPYLVTCLTIACEKRLRACDQPPDLAIRADDPMLNVVQAIPGRVMGAPDSRCDELTILGMYAIDKRLQGHRFIHPPAVDLPLLRRPVDGVGEVVMIEDADLGSTDGLAQSLFAVLQCILHLLVLGDVPSHADDRHHLARFIPHCLVGPAEPAPARCGQGALLVIILVGWPIQILHGPGR
ncbi:MAG: hypothetical protein AW09_002394 [Candidatus Accumulibacter phosphatis]|uniref:Uncharacterized protein n=1 Tax=Candidatus Accumulibacter phosphatis TaxID=327160 RepID=A0A080LV21_9PROT|nr:MAG: hypothetical protein AW09_002394 [Candidatus Accumulibacter phosphatis]